MPSTLPDSIMQQLRYGLIAVFAFLAGKGYSLDASTQTLILTLAPIAVTAFWGWYVKKGTVSVAAEVAKPADVVSPVTGQTK